MNQPYFPQGYPQGYPQPAFGQPAPGPQQPAQGYPPAYSQQPAAGMPQAAPQGFPQGFPGGAVSPGAYPQPAAQQLSPQQMEALAFQQLQGLNEAAVETRLPFLPPDLQVLVELTDVRLGGLMAGSSTGLSFYIEHKIIQASRPDLTPAGQGFSHRISGFKSVEGAKFAMSELKQFISVALADRGLTETWQGDWISCAIHMAQQGWCKGKRMVIQTSTVVPKRNPNNKPKTKAIFYPAPAGY